MFCGSRAKGWPKKKESPLPSPPTLICLDTNVYSRPFDDQTQPGIQEEANAFLDIISGVRAGELALLCSDILMFEVCNILEEEKRTKIEAYLSICAEHVENSEAVLALGKNTQSACQIRPRDALHVASAILGHARYFLSCDDRITQMRQARCYRRLAESQRDTYFSAMNPLRFTGKMKKGELE